MPTPATTPPITDRRHARRAAVAGLTLLIATGTGLLSAGAAAAASEDVAQSVLAPVTNAFSDTEETPLDQFLNTIVPQEASDVIGTASAAADPALDAADAALAAGGAEDSDDADSTSVGQGNPR